MGKRDQQPQPSLHYCHKYTRERHGVYGSGSTTTFTTTVSPRNNGNTGGVPPPLPRTNRVSLIVASSRLPPTGKRTIPVMLLREFRDRFLQKCYFGRCFIDTYYKVGPSLADLIRNRPWACFSVRVLLSPVAGIVLLIMYFPASIPVILIFPRAAFILYTINFRKPSPQRRSIIPKTRWPDSRGRGRSLEDTEAKARGEKARKLRSQALRNSFSTSVQIPFFLCVLCASAVNECELSRLMKDRSAC